jgi:hypothetical protein
MPETIYLRCPVCAAWVEIRTTRTRVPWAKCDDCSLRIFWQTPGVRPLNAYLSKTEQPPFEPKDEIFD